MKPPRARFASLFFLCSFLFVSSAACSVDSRLESIRLPPGFRISLYAGNVPGARSMALGPGGVIFVGSRREGNVYAVMVRESGNRADEVITIARGLTMPNGVAYRDGSLYVAEVSRILRYDGIASRLRNPGEPVVVYDRFPSAGHHGWKFIRFGPDGLLYVPVGAPCNVCEVKDPFGTITRIRPDGSGFEVFARGVRNSVGFDWDPKTMELWFTDNGRDWLGDDLPPDELNHAPVINLHFGFPYRHGKEIPDPEFVDRNGKKKFLPPARELGPHVAALGMRFYTGSMFPPRYRNQIFIAEHGSWNRSTPIGYRITLVTRGDGQENGYEVFAEGWLSKRGAWGRPVDVLVMPDGALLVSDDKAGAIYRITYED
ncbi:MAG: PQQ-dependent sugar dehydrogenase [Candidatus Deferrimicrobiaceae bacterium]